MSGEITVIEKTDRLLPSKEVLESLKEQAKALVDAGMLPPGYKTAADALVVALKAREMGVMPMRGWQGMFPMRGRIGYMGAFLLGLLYEREPEAEIRVVENTVQMCVLKVSRTKADEPHIVTVTSEEAKLAHWDVTWDDKGSCFKPKPTWADRANMLYWRCVTRTFNRHFSHITGGTPVYTADEIEDIRLNDEYIPPAIQAKENVPYVVDSKPEEAVVLEQKDDEKNVNVKDELLDFKTDIAFCSTEKEIEDAFKAFKLKNASNGKLLNDALKAKNERKKEIGDKK